jgi:hypothetical protein
MFYVGQRPKYKRTKVGALAQQGSIVAYYKLSSCEKSIFYYYSIEIGLD